uniref:dynein axonemal assembly factor 4 isoform X2 n=1 Tax=Monopterus albus TaxID=43700 RepID=UPI0009B4DBFE|nr:dyslexia susceptibility 1 candidate gene 1 protein isoform X2 [Monopterus albus]
MPFLVSDYWWSQTYSTVHINVPLKGAQAGNVDIVSTDEYLKVHYPPYLFEAFLFEPVDDDRSTAKIGNGVAIITLPKRTNKMWEHLMITTNDKLKKKDIREQALLKYQEKLFSKSRSQAEKKHAENKYAMETMMKLEKEERDSIQKMKDTEREKTTAELVAWQLRRKQKAEEEAQVNCQSQRDYQNKLEAMRENQDNGCLAGGNVNLVQRSTSEKCKKKQVDLPAPRFSGNIQVTFTPRVFPTALRESRVPEEEEALDLLTPPVAANAAARARAHVRRGSAFCQLQLYAEGLQDYEAAVKIDPHNEVLQSDTQRIRDIIQGTAAKQEIQ